MILWLLACGDTETSGPLASKSALLSWCGEELCDWVVEEGVVERVPTWHEEEFGARLGGERTVLSREWIPPEGAATCFELGLTSQRLFPPSLEVELIVGSEPAPLSWTVPPSDYELERFPFELAVPPDSLTLRVRKEGGDAVLAYLTLAELVALDGC